MFYWIYRDICYVFIRYEVDVIENNYGTCIIFYRKKIAIFVLILLFTYMFMYIIFSLMILVSSSINIKGLSMYLIVI